MIITPNTKGLWRFEGNANDNSGNGNNGTVYGASLAAGKFGQCYSFDGVDDYITCGDVYNDIIAGANKKFSMCAWINASEIVAGGRQIAAKLGDGVSGGTQRQFGWGVSNGKLRLIYYGELGTGKFRLFETNEVMTAGVDYHVAFTYDGTLAYDNRVKLYINAVDTLAPVILSAGNPDAIQIGTAQFSIGAARNTATAYMFKGKIDEVCIFNTVLSQANIQRIMIGLHPII